MYTIKNIQTSLSKHFLILFYNWLSFGYGGAWEDEKNKFFTEFKMIHNLWVDELFQNQYIVDAINGLIHKYNLNPKETPLFEFQRDRFEHKMKDIQDESLCDPL